MVFYGWNLPIYPFYEWQSYDGECVTYVATQDQQERWPNGQLFEGFRVSYYVLY